MSIFLEKLYKLIKRQEQPKTVTPIVHHIPNFPLYVGKEEQKPMLSDLIPKYLTTTCSIRLPNSHTFCGSTENDFTEETKDPFEMNPKPLKHLLVKKFPWILDVTAVKIKYRGNRHRFDHLPKDAVIHGPLEIHLTVSATHHTELMNPQIENLVRENLFKFLLPLIPCIYPNNGLENPIIIFSPSHSTTILELLK